MNLVIDGDMVLHRALYAKKILTMKTSYGQHTGILYAALNTVNNYTKILAGFNPKRIFFLVGGGKSKRVDIYPEYKAKSDKDINDWNSIIESIGKSNSQMYSEQKALCKSVLEPFGVHYLSCPTYEADDLAFLFSNTFSLSNSPSILISDDGDWEQLISPFVQLYKPTKEQIVTSSSYYDYAGIPLDSVTCYLAMLGGHDNIKKPLSGFGEVGIKKMIGSLSSYTVDNIIEYAKQHKPTSKQYQLSNEDVINQYKLNLKLVDLSELAYTQDVKSVVSTALSSRRSFDHQLALEVLNKYEFKSLTMLLNNPIIRGLY
jgi:5'-3' exonuclease